MEYIRKIVLMLLLSMVLTTFSKTRPVERRVYYLDCSYSMKSTKTGANKILWDEVTEDLKSAINNISDQRTEIVLIPFAVDGNNSYKKLSCYSFKADTVGKGAIKRVIDSIEPKKTSKTYHELTLEDFYENHRWGNESVLTYMFILTDGKDEMPKSRFPSQLSQWESRCHDNVYGFYVKLDSSASYPAAESEISNVKHFFTLTTSNVNINLIKFSEMTCFNAKTDEYCIIDLETGNVDSECLSISLGKNNYYKIEGSPIVEGDKIKVRIKPIDKSGLPTTTQNEIYIKYTSGDKLDICLTKKVIVKCEYKPERNLKVRFE